MEILERQHSPSSINVDNREPQLSNASLSISIQPRIGSTTPCNNTNDKQNTHDDVVSLDFHKEVLEAFEDNVIFSYQAKIFVFITKPKVNASAIISD